MNILRLSNSVKVILKYQTVAYSFTVATVEEPVKLLDTVVEIEDSTTYFEFKSFD